MTSLMEARKWLINGVDRAYFDLYTYRKVKKPCASAWGFFYTKSHVTSKAIVTQAAMAIQPLFSGSAAFPGGVFWLFHVNSVLSE
jgi:hypothetical protein